MAVTARQRQVYEFIRRYLEVNNQPPTIAEIGKHFQMTSPASVHSIVSALEREGLIKRIPNVSRGIELIEQEGETDESEIPLLGTVAAGQPIEAILSHETVTAPKNMIGRGRMSVREVRAVVCVGRVVCVRVEISLDVVPRSHGRSSHPARGRVDGRIADEGDEHAPARVGVFGVDSPLRLEDVEVVAREQLARVRVNRHVVPLVRADLRRDVPSQTRGVADAHDVQLREHVLHV